MLRLILSFSLAFVLWLPARAQTDAIKGVITSQLEAFQADDLPRAFSFASPTIKGMFGTPENFGVMVKRGYPMVWRPADMRFGPLEIINGRNVQIVFFTDLNGAVFEASYEMIETENGWQINGVSLKEAGLGA